MSCLSGCVLCTRASEGGEQGGLGPHLGFEIFSKKRYFLSFEWEISNFTTFGPPLEKQEKCPSGPPLEKSFRRPWLCCIVCTSWNKQTVQWIVSALTTHLIIGVIKMNALFLFVYFTAGNVPCFRHVSDSLLLLCDVLIWLCIDNFTDFVGTVALASTLMFLRKI